LKILKGVDYALFKPRYIVEISPEEDLPDRGAFKILKKPAVTPK
jgi:hypothetical protein